ncbi:MAG: UDP-N-acetylmuramate--L-alanine ligase [Ruminococcus sp.]|nr:UDP-N-acetylmuramate--L-alanine ligase [Ruminococcus sp.]
MYPLAQILHGQGYFLTGSDNNDTETLQAVRDMGIPVYLGQRTENIGDADVIVHTAAISEDNPELKAARASGARVLERSELLGIITENFGNALCVSGTHGKTTVTSMITQILVKQGLDISAVIGGKLPLIHGSGVAGSSDTVVCEACEFKDHFLNLASDTSVILNIDEDHLDYFKNIDNIIKSFHKFCEQTTRTVIINGGDENSMKAVEGITGKEIITFGSTPDNDWYPADINRISGMNTEFTIMHSGKPFCGTSLHVPGEHNILNAVAAAAAAYSAGATPEGVSEGLSSFHGAGRRFEKYGEVRGVTVVDDYGHHPAEIAVTLKAAKKLGFKRVWAVHQPFTFSRTALLLEDFAKALSIADKVVLTAIMGGREENTVGVHTKDLAEKIEGCVYFEEEEHDANFELTARYAAENAEEGDLIVTLGCGDVNKAARRILELLEDNSNK